MIFGDPQQFAIEALLDGADSTCGPVSGNNIAGRIRVWMSGSDIGDFDEEHCWLGPVYMAMAELRLEKLWHPSFGDLSCDEIFDRLNLVKFAADRQGCGDNETLPDIESQGEQLARFTFLLNSSEAFDGWKSFLVHPPGSELMALVMTHGSPEVDVFRFSAEAFRSAVNAFGQWIRMEEQRLIPECRAEQSDAPDA